MTSESEQPPKFRALVIDSGPIIHTAGLSALFHKAETFYTVPAVMEEIRDAKARKQLEQHLWQLAATSKSELQVRQPSAEAIQRVTEFSKLTGDYPSLSIVDMQVLALTIDLEREGTLTLDHLRTTPKRTVGIGRVQPMKKADVTSSGEPTSAEDTKEMEPVEEEIVEEVDYDSEDSEDESEENESDPANDLNDDTPESEPVNPTPAPAPVPTKPAWGAPKSWANLVNPSQGSAAVNVEGAAEPVVKGSEAAEAPSLEKELESDFPSLAAAATVPYEGEDGEEQPANDEPIAESEDVAETEAALSKLDLEEQERQRKKKEALQPISKSGKLYNSFRGYRKLMKPKPVDKTAQVESKVEEDVGEEKVDPDAQDVPPTANGTSSRILGGGSMMADTAVSEMNADDDDGEGWITCTKDIATLKHNGGGTIDPAKGVNGSNLQTSNKPEGPPESQRTACTTTDFAMQNVLLQMGLALLSVNGMKIRRLKSWVMRCGACYKIHTDLTDPSTGMRRLFCTHCGSDMMQRVSASVDSQTGRLRIHLSKKYQHNLRGTKFSLPKAGANNRFQGDLLLREDQLHMGAWSQKVKKNGGGQSKAHAQSIFGKDIASNVGCQASVTPNDIRVGFGRRNPNAAKGRERRGKKKKSGDRACGLRRY